MPAINNLQDLYVDELKDLWSANDQMVRALQKMSPKASNPKLRQLLEKSVGGIDKHTGLLKTLIEGQNGTVSKEHCRGMEGLVNEALKHSLDDAPAQGPVLDAVIIAQFQRMTHYGITGFGTVAAFAQALRRTDDRSKIEAAVKEMHVADDLMSEIAESAVNPQAAGR